MGLFDRGIQIKTPEQIAKMRVAGLLVGETLEVLRASVRAGISTGELDAVVVLTVDSEELVQRLLQRAETDGRSDDTEDVIRRRQEVYAEQTEPLIGVYRDRGIVQEIDGIGEVTEVTDRIFAALDVVPQS